MALQSSGQIARVPCCSGVLFGLKFGGASGVNLGRKVGSKLSQFGVARAWFPFVIARLPGCRQMADGCCVSFNWQLQSRSANDAGGLALLFVMLTWLWLEMSMQLS